MINTEFQTLFMAEFYQKTASTSDTLPTRLTGFPKFRNMYVTRNIQHGTKNYIQCNSMIEEATKAYKIQFTKDMITFLEARAEEIVPGGLMIALGQCLPDGVLLSETWEGIVIDTIGDCLMDMAKSGLTSKEEIELFSLPLYFHQFNELKGEIEQNESFTIELMETISHPFQDIQLTNDFTTSTFRAILSSVVEKHFGDDVVDDLFSQLTKKLNKYPIDFEKCKKQMVYCILLRGCSLDHLTYHPDGSSE